MNHTQIVCAPTNASADGIALSQTPAGAGNLTINGAQASGGVATLGAAQIVTITSVGDDSGRTFTVYGTDAEGDTQSQAVTGAAAGAASTTLYFKTVTRVAVDDATADAVTVGFTAAALSPMVKLFKFQQPARVAVGCVVSGTINYTLQNCYEPAPHSNWVDNATVSGKTANAEYSYTDTPAMAVRVKVASATGGSVSANFIHVWG